jgi:hypothetical protein
MVRVDHVDTAIKNAQKPEEAMRSAEVVAMLIPSVSPLVGDTRNAGVEDTAIRSA